MSQGEGGGRPRKFQTVAIFEEQVEDYFNSIAPTDENPHGLPATRSGLCLHLDTFPDVLTDYERGKYDDETEKFSAAVKKARLRIISYAESMLYLGKNAAGPIFHLTNLTRTQDEESRWRNEQRNEQTGPNGDNLKTEIIIRYADAKISPQS